MMFWSKKTKPFRLGGKRLKKTMWAWCPGCGNDLITDTGKYWYDKLDTVMVCSKCDTISRWNLEGQYPELLEYV